MRVLTLVTSRADVVR